MRDAIFMKSAHELKRPYTLLLITKYLFYRTIKNWQSLDFFEIWKYSTKHDHFCCVISIWNGAASSIVRINTHRQFLISPTTTFLATAQHKPTRHDPFLCRPIVGPHLTYRVWLFCECLPSFVKVFPDADNRQNEWSRQTYVLTENCMDILVRTHGIYRHSTW